jgi:hypothetical protein
MRSIFLNLVVCNLHFVMIREPSSTEDISTAFSVENKILKRKIEKLHRENIQLKKSLFEINIRYT